MFYTGYFYIWIFFLRTTQPETSSTLKVVRRQARVPFSHFNLKTGYRNKTMAQQQQQQQQETSLGEASSSLVEAMKSEISQLDANCQPHGIRLLNDGKKYFVHGSR